MTINAEPSITSNGGAVLILKEGETEPWGWFWKKHGIEARGTLLHDYNDWKREDDRLFFSAEVKVGQVFPVWGDDMVSLGIVERIEDDRVFWRMLVTAYDHPDEGHKYALWVEEDTYLIGPHKTAVIEATPVIPMGFHNPKEEQS